MTPKLSPLKAGSTFSYAGTCRLPPGLWTATCQLRSSEEPFALIGTVAVTLGAPVGLDTPIALYASAADTRAWPVGLHELDIRYQDSTGAVVHTSTIGLPVLRSITGA
jgi:hypothetical protein